MLRFEFCERVSSEDTVGNYHGYEGDMGEYAGNKLPRVVHETGAPAGPGRLQHLRVRPVPRHGPKLSQTARKCPKRPLPRTTILAHRSPVLPVTFHHFSTGKTITCRTFSGFPGRNVLFTLSASRVCSTRPHSEIARGIFKIGTVHGRYLQTGSKYNCVILGY